VVWKTVPDDRSGNAETSFGEFRRRSLHGQISTFRRTETAARGQRYSPPVADRKQVGVADREK